MLLKGCWSCSLFFQSLKKIGLSLRDKYNKKVSYPVYFRDMRNNICYNELATT